MGKSGSALTCSLRTLIRDQRMRECIRLVGARSGPEAPCFVVCRDIRRVESLRPNDFRRGAVPP